MEEQEFKKFIEYDYHVTPRIGDLALDTLPTKGTLRHSH